MTLSDEQRKAMFANLGKGKPKKKTKLKRPKTGKTSKVQRWQPKGYTGIGLVRKKALDEMKRTPVKRTKLKHLHLGSDSMDAQIRGQKDGSQIGKKSGGRGRNETPNCRHPEKNLKSKKWRKVKGTIAIDTWLKDKNIVLVERSKTAPGWVALYGKEGEGANWISNKAVSRKQARKQAINFMQGKYKKSPMGRLYIGKATFQNAKWAQERANHLKAQRYDAWVEGKTVYNH